MPGLRPAVGLRLKAPAVSVRAMLSIREPEFKARKKLKSLLSPQTIWWGLREPRAWGVWVNVEVGPWVELAVPDGVGLELGLELGVTLEVGVKLGVALWLALNVGLAVGDEVGLAL